MHFKNIVTDSTLYEHLGYHIPVDKVAWDRQGNPKKPSLPSERVVLSSHAWPLSKKSRAHKNVSALRKSTIVPKSAQKDAVTRSSSHHQVRENREITSTVKEGSSTAKRKLSVDAPALVLLQKKGRVEKENELLQMIAFVRSDSVSVSFWPPGGLEEAQAPNPFREAIPLDVVPLSTQSRERGGTDYWTE
jgi:hypothetical protein